MAFGLTGKTELAQIRSPREKSWGELDSWSKNWIFSMNFSGAAQLDREKRKNARRGVVVIVVASFHHRVHLGKA